MFGIAGLKPACPHDELGVSNVKPNGCGYDIILIPHRSEKEEGVKGRIVTALIAATLAGPLARAAPAGPAPAAQLLVDPAGPGLVFEGIGAASGGGATSRLLIDYPEPQRSQILDFLFLPHFGASLQALKVEIGSDGNATEGAEPTHMRTADDEDYTRGYEWWLMREARKRNPAIRIDALAWNFPAWVGQANSAASARYLTAFVRGARTVHGVDIDTIGLWNETKMDPSFIPLLRETLDAAGLRTRIVADDLVNDWSIVDTMAARSDVRAAVAVISTHYPRFESPATVRARAAEWGRPLWSSEDGPWGDGWADRGEQSPPLAELLNRNYIQGRMTSTNVWNLVSAYYDVLELPYAGLMRANTPWSGHYEVRSPIWVVAHTTQFTAPGWRYLDQASGRLPGGGSHVTLTDGKDYSVIVETLAGTEPQTLRLRIAPALAGRPVHVWRSTATRQFEEIGTLDAAGGMIDFTAAPGSVYTLSTTTGQRHGLATPPRARPFPLPFAERFDGRAPGQSPPWFADVNGAFEVRPCPGGRTGQCLVQQTPAAPIPWTYWVIKDLGAASVVGAADWRNYTVSTRARLDGPGQIGVMARVTKVIADGELRGYRLLLDEKGRWSLRTSVKGEPIASGQVAAKPGQWRQLAITADGGRITGSIDTKVVVRVHDTSHAAGLAGIGSSWQNAAFDDFAVRPVAKGRPVIVPLPVPPANVPPRDAAKLYVPVAGDRMVQLSWSAVPGATRYRVRIGRAENQWDATVDVGSETGHSFRTLTNDQRYYFQVVPVNAAGEGPPAGQYATPRGP
jgi:hypothetical protein